MKMRISFALLLLLALPRPSDAALQSRMDGQSYYDTLLNITWLTDANYAKTSGFSADGTMPDFTVALSFVAHVNNQSAPLLGRTDWRMTRSRSIGFNDVHLFGLGDNDNGFNVSAPGTAFAGSTASELPHLFYNTLGNAGPCSVGGIACFTGPFENVVTGNTFYRSKAFAPIDPFTGFMFNNGFQWTGIEGYRESVVWLVRDGDIGGAIAPVPVTGVAPLFSIAALGLFGVGRGRQCGRTRR